MAILIFLTATARTWIVTPSFIPYVRPDWFGCIFADWLWTAIVYWRGTTAAHIAEALADVAGYWCGLLWGQLNTKNLLHDPMLNLGLQFLPNGKGFTLVFYQWVTLTDGDEANAFAQYIKIGQMADPELIDGPQHNLAFSHPHDLWCELDFLRIVDFYRALDKFQFDFVRLHGVPSIGLDSIWNRVEGQRGAVQFFDLPLFVVIRKIFLDKRVNFLGGHALDLFPHVLGV